MEGHGERVVVVDDDPGMIELASRVLTQVGYEVAAAPDARSGLEEVEARPTPVALVDLVMPGMGGIELGKAIRDRGRLTQVVIITGRARATAVLEAFGAGVSDYVHKPFDGFDELLGAVSRAVIRYNRWRALVMDAAALRRGRARPGLRLGDVYEPAELAARRVAFLRRALDRIEASPLGAELADLGHSLAGSGGTLGLPELVEPGRRLEEMALGGASPEAARTLTAGARLLLLSRLAELEPRA